MLTMPLYGLLYIGYANRKSMGVDIFHLTIDLERSWSRSLGFVTCQIEATVAWNMMVTKNFILGPTLTNKVTVKL